MRKTHAFPLLLTALLIASLLTGCVPLGETQSKELVPVAQEPPEEVRPMIPTPIPQEVAGKEVKEEAASEVITGEAEETKELPSAPISSEKEAPSAPLPLQGGQPVLEGEGEGPAPEGPAPSAPALEPWQEEIVQDYLEAWTYFFEELEPDPTQVEYYFQDVSWQGEEMAHENHIVQGVKKYLLSLDAQEWKDVHEIATRDVRVGSLHPTDAHLVKVVDYASQGAVVHKVSLINGETIEDMTLAPYANLVIMIYDEPDQRWKIGALERIDLSLDPQQAAHEVQKLLTEEAVSWE